MTEDYQRVQVDWLRDKEVKTQAKGHFWSKATWAQRSGMKRHSNADVCKPLTCLLKHILDACMQLFSWWLLVLPESARDLALWDVVGMVSHMGPALILWGIVYGWASSYTLSLASCEQLGTQVRENLEVTQLLFLVNTGVFATGTATTRNRVLIFSCNSKECDICHTWG